MLTWEFPPRMIGGLARHAFELCKSLVKNGTEVFVVTARDEKSTEYEKVEGIHVFRVQALQYGSVEFMHWIGSLNLSFINKVANLDKKIKFDMIHAHDWLVHASAFTLKNQLQIPLITTIHATEQGRNQGIHTSLQSNIQKKEIELIKRSDAIIACSDYMKNEIIELVPTAMKKIRVIPNGVDQTFFDDKKICSSIALLPEKKDHPIIFTMGRMVPEKGFHTLIEAVPIILKEYPNVKLIMAGKGPLEKQYFDVIQQMGLSHHVQLIGFLDDMERNELLKIIDIAVFPSIYEPFGIAALEAMIAGKPVVTSSTGGLVSFVKNGVTGITVKPGDALGLSKAIISLLANPVLASRLAKNGQIMAVEEYNWKNIAELTERYYMEVLKELEVIAR